MANDKDFIVKDAVEVGGSVKTTVGTVTSGSVGYYLAGASYTQGYTQSQSTDPRGPVFKTDGTKMYLVTITTVYQYSLSTAWDVTTASYESKSFNASSQDSQPYGARFKPDGTKMFIVGATNDSIFQYSLSTAWDVSTASYDSVTLSVNSQDTTPTALAFKPDGTRMYITGNQNDSVYQYTLSTAWDLSTASYDSVSLSVSSQDSFPDGVDFNSTGTNMFVSGAGSDSVYQYTLSTAWDLSTASYSNISFSVASQSTTPYGLVFGDSGTKMYITNGNSPYNILQYSTSQSSQSLGLSTGNYFNHTLTENTQFLLSNAGDVQAFQLEVTGGSSAGYDLSNASYDSKSFSVTNQDVAPRGLYFKSDGLTFFMIGNGNDNVNEYTLTEAWDITTSSFTSNTFSVVTQEGFPRGLFFKTDGTKMYIVGSGATGNLNDSVFQYTLSTAWDITTASYDSINLSVSGQDTVATDIRFKPDGTVMYISGTSSDSIHQYTLSTAWDLSTASYASKALSVASQDTQPESFYFNEDGSKIFVLGIINDNVYQYSLSTAYDVSSGSYDSISFDISSQEGGGDSLWFGYGGKKMFVMGSGSDTIYQYNTGTPATVTWPSSIEWPDGTAPLSPADGEKDLYTITTDDSGTTYKGVLSAYNLS
jgi:6-phosphogluconolactonase (cycloisomerase 2 family)